MILFALQLWFQVMVIGNLGTYVLTKIVEKVPIVRKLLIFLNEYPILKYVLVSIMFLVALPDRRLE